MIDLGRFDRSWSILTTFIRFWSISVDVIRFFMSLFLFNQTIIQRCFSVEPSRLYSYVLISSKLTFWSWDNSVKKLSHFIVTTAYENGLVFLFSEKPFKVKMTYFSSNFHIFSMNWKIRYSLESRESNLDCHKGRHKPKNNSRFIRLQVRFVYFYHSYFCTRIEFRSRSLMN